jgi:hypothetical protein
MSTTGYIYLTQDQLNKLFVEQPSYQKTAFTHPRLKYCSGCIFTSRKWNETDLIVPNYSLIGSYRRSYISNNQGIERFIQQHPEIQYDTDDEIHKIEQDYDNQTDFMNDFDDRLENMGVGKLNRIPFASKN